MINFFLILLVSTSLSAMAANAPKDCEGKREYQLDLRAIKEFEKFDVMAELEMNDTAYTDNYKHYQIGARYLLSNGLKAGLHLKYSRGNRHDADWFPIGGGVWAWQSTKGRYEVEVFPEIDYRRWIFKSPFAATMRARYIYNEYNEEQSLLLRAGLIRYWEKITLSAQYEINYPLNYSEHTIDESWFYLGALLPITKHFTLGHTMGIGKWGWSNPEGYPGTYKNEYKATKFNVFLNYYF